MPAPVKHDPDTGNTPGEDTQRILARVKSLAKTQHERAALFGWTPRYQRMVERGHIPNAALRFFRAGVFTLAPDTEEAHDDTTAKQ